MPPAVTKANYKTYESQARLVRAIVAAHPEVKWNYKGKLTPIFSVISSSHLRTPPARLIFLPAALPHHLRKNRITTTERVPLNALF